MPRTARLYAPNTFHHITAGFVNGEFRMRGARERDEYLRRLAAALRRTDWKLLSYVLMSSHTHLGAESGETPVQELMLSLQGGFGGWINVVHGRSGPVWADRFYEIIGDAAPFAAHMITYHHNNPVRAEVVESPEQSDWSSHAAYLDPLRRPPFLDVRRGLELCGFGDDAKGRAAFHRLTLERIAVGRIEWMKPEWVGRVLSRVRRASGWPVEAGQPHVLVGSDDHRAEQFEVEVPILVAAASRMGASRTASGGRDGGGGLRAVWCARGRGPWAKWFAGGSRGATRRGLGARSSARRRAGGDCSRAQSSADCGFADHGAPAGEPIRRRSRARREDRRCDASRGQAVDGYDTLAQLVCRCVAFVKVVRGVPANMMTTRRNSSVGVE